MDLVEEDALEREKGRQYAQEAALRDDPEVSRIYIPFLFHLCLVDSLRINVILVCYRVN